MTSSPTVSAPATATSPPRSSPRHLVPPLRAPRGADSALILLTALLFVLPSGLVLGPLGAAGSPAALLGLILLGWWTLARQVPGLGVSPDRQPVRLALYFFQFAVGASFLAGALRPITGEEMSSSVRGLLSACAWSGIVLVAADGLGSRAALERVLRALVAAAGFLSVLGIVQFATGWNPASLIRVPGLTMNSSYGLSLARDTFTRVSGTATHAIEFGVVLAMILPLALHYCWFARRHRNWYRFATVLIGLSLPLTVSRSAVAGALIVLLVMFLAWPARRRLHVLLALPFLLLLLKVMVPGLLGAFRNLFVNISGDPSTQGRTDDYTAVDHYFAQSPWFGRGVSTFIPELYRTLDNAYLGWLIEVGLLGFVALTALILTGAVVCLQVRVRAADEETRDLAAALVAGLLSGAFNFATFDALGFAMCAGVFFLLLGTAGALWRLTPDRRRPGPSAPAPPSGPWSFSRLVLDGVAPVAGAVVAVAAIVLAGGPGLRYQTDAAVLLEAPAGSPGAVNPYADSPYLDLPSELAQRMITSPATVARLRAAGLDAEYSVAAGIGSLMPLTERDGQGPLIRIRVISTSASRALAARATIVKDLERQFTSAQLAAGAPVTELIRVVPTAWPETAVPRRGHPAAALVVGAALGLAAGAVLARGIKAAFRQRRPQPIGES